MRLVNMIGQIMITDPKDIDNMYSQLPESTKKSIERRDGIEIINEQFKEFLGHTPIEVLVGSILGIIIGLLFKGYILG